MLGKTAGGLFWMFRYLERSENTARLIETGMRISLTRAETDDDEWKSVLRTAGVDDLYHHRHAQIEASKAIDFLLRDAANPSSVLSCITAARHNARAVRTAITREVWEAVNDTYITLKRVFARPIATRDLPEILGTIRQHSALVRGATHGSMLRNDVFDFCRLGTFLERADNTARILDVKYYVLLPSVSQIGSPLDNTQWETILRSVAGQRAYRWLMQNKITAVSIADFLIFDGRMPRSLIFAIDKISSNLAFLQKAYDTRHPCHDKIDGLKARLHDTSIDQVFDEGLHEFILDFLAELAALSSAIEQDYRFLG
jgi:uncharacterized alpha-E superfamily protein